MVCRKFMIFDQWCCDTVGLSMYMCIALTRTWYIPLCIQLFACWVVTSVSVVHELLQVRWNCMCLQLHFY